MKWLWSSIQPSTPDGTITINTLTWQQHMEVMRPFIIERDAEMVAFRMMAMAFINKVKVH